MTLVPELNNVIIRIISFLNNSASHNQICQVQAQLILQNLVGDSTIGSHFITACQSLGLLDFAHLFHFTQIRRPHVFICNSLIRAFSHSDNSHAPLSIYLHMLRNSIIPNNFTYPFLLKSSFDFCEFKQRECVRTHVIKLGHLNDIYVLNSLHDAYVSAGHIYLCWKLFDEMPQRDVVSWTVLIMGYQNARKYDDALIAFEQMQYAGVIPNHVTMVDALAACANSGALEMGVWIHDFIKRN